MNLIGLIKGNGIHIISESGAIFEYTKEDYRKNVIINLNKLLSIVNININNLIYDLEVMIEDVKIS